MNEFWRKLCDLTGSDNYIRTFADPARQVLKIDTYAYSVDGNVLAANITQTAAQSFELIMDSDSDFVLTYFSGFARANGNTLMIVAPAIGVQITDQSSGRNFFNKAAPMPLLCGQSGFPFLLTSPRVIKPRTSLNITAQSLQNAAFTGFYFTLHGARIYYA